MHLKRLMDIMCCFLGMIVFGPIMLSMAILIKLEDGGDIFFWQYRIGKGMWKFRCLKFRTMRDGKITKVGKFIRNTGLDELAQIFNILRGEMSVVGPRPLTKDDIERLGWEHEELRWHLKPGMTGLAQLYKGRGAQLSLYLDKYYNQKFNFFLDCKIILCSLVINFLGRKNFYLLREKVKAL